MSRLPHFLDSRLTDGGEVISLTHRLLFTPRKIHHGTPYILKIPMKQSEHRLPHFLESQVTDGGEVVSLTHQTLFTPRMIPPGTLYILKIPMN
jgi:hypothetical protein